jgi:quercetin dioxygenase-like cupin family protein
MEKPMNKDAIITDITSIVPCQVLAERITILADYSQTGSYEVFVHDAPEGSGPPPHSHPWDEAFYVIEGEVDFDFGGSLKKVKTGGFVHVPGGMVHAFRYASATARILAITSGKGAAAMFTAVDRECGAAPDISKVVAVLDRHHVTVANSTA